jgi:hypothetical protein
MVEEAKISSSYNSNRIVIYLSPTVKNETSILDNCDKTQ